VFALVTAIVCTTASAWDDVETIASSGTVCLNACHFTGRHATLCHHAE